MDFATVFQYITVFIVSFLPIAEVRGGIPLAFYYFYNSSSKLAFAVTLAVIGNLLIAPFVLYLLKYLDYIIRNSNVIPNRIRKAYLWVINYVKKKSMKFERYEVPALAIFVAIPLPATGAWTASLIAFLIGMEKKKALIAIEIGVLGASAIVLLTCLLGLTILKKLFLIP
ncbi:small multi-drug export protein [Ignisphaera sp. 4213-co]|uniref:Small multi-drug export protein n=1 Tax=Ignisphaera cupida TaxID=3050454 RepID=A0ABD4Z7I3_9CREN|nr:small multi-drug export protein [Ignisphaera sp. 4213-co]MDK6029165.1 small multi-drug export protein [Ignisphaera sp. 4213-co]